MKVFLGVQATGNGHITRARVMAPAFRAAGIDVQYLFSGRPWEQLFEMEIFGDYEWRAGLTFLTKAGHVQYVKTAFHNNSFAFLRDIRNLDLSGYDVVITDFEPVTAWAAKLQGIPVIGLGHQYAFGYDIPRAGENFIGSQVLRWFAPATTGLGVHWHHFHHPILPPLIETPPEPECIQQDKIVVYLPFEDVNQVVHLLKTFRQHQFFVYSPAMPHDRHEKSGNVHVRQLSRAGFQHDFRDCAGVICNAGFELASEALQMGKRILVKPLLGQMEQQSNALALELLQMGQVMQSLDHATIANWLEHSRPVRIVYPDVAKAIVNWLQQGDRQLDKSWIDGIWEQTLYLN